MKLFPVAALALFAAAPAFAATPGFLVDFEKNWDYSNGDVNNYYNGGTAAVGATTGPSLGVSFVNVSGLSNDSAFTYYSGAPTMQGTAYVHDTAFMNVSAGVDNLLSFFYSSPSSVLGAVKAYSGLNGTGTLLGTLDLAANDTGVHATESGSYGTWTAVNFTFAGTAQSFDLSGSANVVALDNISAVPEPASVLMMLVGGAVALRLGTRRRV